MQQYTTAYTGIRRQEGGSARGRGQLAGRPTTERQSKGGESRPRDRNTPPGAPARERDSAWQTKKWEAPSRVGKHFRPGRVGDVGAVVWPAVVRGAAGRQRTGSRSVGDPERLGRGGVNSGRKEPGAQALCNNIPPPLQG